MGTSRPSRQKSLLEGQYAGKVLPALEGRVVSTHWPKALPALSEEHKRGSTRWDETVGVSEGFDPSSSPGITKENTPFPSAFTPSAMKPSASSSGIHTPLETSFPPHSPATCPELCKERCLVCFCGANIERSHIICLKAQNCVRDTRGAQLPFPVLRSPCTLHQGCSFRQETLTFSEHEA